MKESSEWQNDSKAESRNRCTYSLLQETRLTITQGTLCSLWAVCTQPHPSFFRLGVHKLSSPGEPTEAPVDAYDMHWVFVCWERMQHSQTGFWITPLDLVLVLILLTSFVATSLSAASSIFVLTPMIRLDAFYYFSSHDLQTSFLWFLVPCLAKHPLWTYFIPGTLFGRERKRRRRKWQRKGGKKREREGVRRERKREGGIKWEK